MWVFHKTIFRQNGNHWRCLEGVNLGFIYEIGMPWIVNNSSCG